MSEAQPPIFDKEAGERLRSHYDLVRGYVRQELTRMNLWPYISQGPLRVADIGGGDGRDSFWLAEQGHDVVLVDPEETSLLLANERRDSVSTMGQVHLVNGDINMLMERGEKESFDLVLSHGVLMYDYHNPQVHVDKLAFLTKPRGYISLLTKGYQGAIERLTSQDRQEDLANFINNRQMVNNLGIRIQAFDENELETMLINTDAKICKWAGVRIETDNNYTRIEEVEGPELAAILDREYTLGNHPDTRARGQMLHFIAQKI